MLTAESDRHEWGATWQAMARHCSTQQSLLVLYSKLSNNSRSLSNASV
jgi:hypothetical protein